MLSNGACAFAGVLACCGRCPTNCMMPTIWKPTGSSCYVFYGRCSVLLLQLVVSLDLSNGLQGLLEWWRKKHNFAMDVYTWCSSYMRSAVVQHVPAGPTRPLI
jgi:hypothetical protein